LLRYAGCDLFGDIEHFEESENDEFLGE